MQKSCVLALGTMPFGACLLLSVLTAFAAYGRTEYFVDCTRPDDSGDGLTVETAKRTIQAAVDLTNPKGTDIVTVLPGVYDEGSRVITTSEFDHEFRVVITNQLLLRSRDGAAVTTIKGAFGSGSNNLGPGAVRGIYMRALPSTTAQSYTAIEGFTITGCATTNTAASGNRHYGAAVVGSWNQYVLGCVISNNYAVAGAGIYNCNAARCLFIENTASSSAAGVNAYYWNSVIARNHGNLTLSYAKTLANCTCVDNDGILAGGSAQTFYNCVLAGNGGSNGNSTHTHITNTVTDSAASEFKSVGGTSVTGASKYQLVAPAFGDWRLVGDSVAVGIADWDRYFALVNGQKVPYAVSNGYLPSYISTEYAYKDFAGNTLTAGMTMDAGAIQGAMPVNGGRIDFVSEGFLANGWSVPCRASSYAHATEWPSILVCRIVSATGKPIFGCKVTGSYVSSARNYMYPDLDGRFTFAFPPKDKNSELTAYPVQRIYYVDDDGSDSNDGSAPGTAFKTLQKAADTVQANGGSYNLVSVAPGVYNEGGAFAKGLTNRLYVSYLSLQFYAPGGPDVTFIEGAPSPGSDFHGLGSNATRCLYWSSNHPEAAMRGFTFRNGHTSYTDGDKWSVTEANQCGGVYVYVEGSGKVQFLDCVFSNNTALISAVNAGGDFTRCRFVKNRAVNAGGSIGRSGTYRFCSFWDNGPGTYVLDNTAQNIYFCSIDGRAAPYQSNIYGTVNVNPGVAADPIHSNNKSYDGNVLTPGCTVSIDSGYTGCTLNYVSADPKLADSAAGDLHLLAGSPALGAANVANITSILHQVTLDLDGNMPNFVDGIMTAGAYQVPSMLVTVGGREDAVQIDGGAFGANALRPGATITVTAAAVTSGGRKFAGFVVDGEPMPASETVFTYTVPSMPTAALTVDALYSPCGTTMVLR